MEAVEAIVKTEAIETYWEYIARGRDYAVRIASPSFLCDMILCDMILCDMSGGSFAIYLPSLFTQRS